MTTPPTSLEQSLRVLAILFWAIFTGPLLMIGVLYAIRPSGAVALEGDTATMVLVGSFLAAVGAATASNFLKRTMIEAARRRQPRPEPIDLLRVVTILACALCEGAALLGGVAWFLTGQTAAFAASSVALIAMFSHRPTPAALDTLERILASPSSSHER